eukprot:766334-Prorocentrum_minimum.AAC.1
MHVLYPQVHVGEYGAHWNFFFTLAAVALLTSALRIPARSLPPSYLSATMTPSGTPLDALSGGTNDPTVGER